MTFPFAIPDLLLILVVTGMAVGMGHVRSPRAKSLVYMLPLPFSLALIATGKGVDGTHMAGMLAVWAFVWVVWLLHLKLGLPILLADLLAIALHCGISFTLGALIPEQGPAEAFWFWAGAGLLLAGSVAGLLWHHPREPGHRSTLPVYVKAPLVLLIVLGILLAKQPLRGFMPSFPMVTVFAVYEARHSLRTLGHRFAIFAAGFIPLAIVLRLTLPENPVPPLGYLAPLALGWACYLPILILLDRFYAARSSNPTPDAAPDA